MSKGMIYTSFALMASALLVSGAFVLSQDVDTSTSSTRITEASFFMDSVLQDMDRSLSMATRRAYTESSNFVITNNQPLSAPEDNVTSALVNGTLNGETIENMEDVSLESWTERVSGIAEDSSYSLEVSISDYGMNATETGLSAYYEVSATLKDPVSLARFNRTEKANSEVSVAGVEDPMITLRSDSEYVSSFETCSFDRPAELVETGSINSNGYVYGETVLNPADLSEVSSKSEKIIVTDDIDSYPVGAVNQFEGAVSADSNSSSGYTNVYVFNTGSVSGFEDNQTVLVDNGEVWRMSFSRVFLQGCYMTDDSGPDILDRTQNKLSNDGGQGIATFIEATRLPSEVRTGRSAVAHVYFDDNSITLRSIKGVSDEYPWFRLDQEHVDHWGLNPVVK